MSWITRTRTDDVGRVHIYLDSALVWRKARALWKYNELVLTNQGARISMNIL